MQPGISRYSIRRIQQAGKENRGSSILVNTSTLTWVYTRNSKEEEELVSSIQWNAVYLNKK
jgi:hypothetical protein